MVAEEKYQKLCSLQMQNREKKKFLSHMPAIISNKIYFALLVMPY